MTFIPALASSLFSLPLQNEACLAQQAGRGLQRNIPLSIIHVIIKKTDFNTASGYNRWHTIHRIIWPDWYALPGIFIAICPLKFLLYAIYLCPQSMPVQKNNHFKNSHSIKRNYQPTNLAAPKIERR
ncbi:MAG: hypothetical protein P8046_02030 [Anaerolineales bacterium]